MVLYLDEPNIGWSAKFYAPVVLLTNCLRWPAIYGYFRTHQFQSFASCSWRFRRINRIMNISALAMAVFRCKTSCEFSAQMLDSMTVCLAGYNHVADTLLARRRTFKMLILTNDASERIIAFHQDTSSNP